MNWKLIFLLSLFGLAVGISSLFGLGLFQIFIWPIILVTDICVIVICASGKYFLHAFLVAILTEAWITAINAYYLFDMSRVGLIQILPYGIDPQLMNVIEGVVYGVIIGGVTGIIAFSAATFRTNRIPDPN